MSKSSGIDKKVKAYIIEQVEDYMQGEGIRCTSARDYIAERFQSEYGWRVQQVGRQTAMIDWLQGLALPIAFANYEILQLAHKWGSLPDNATEKQEDKLLANYWRFMANKVMQIMDGYRA